jgi:FtsZ-binding cell division protein ZapB
MLVPLHSMEPRDSMWLSDVFDANTPPGLAATQPTQQNLRSRNAYLQSEIARLTEENACLQRRRQGIAQQFQELRQCSRNAYLQSEISRLTEENSCLQRKCQDIGAILPSTSDPTPGLQHEKIVLQMQSQPLGTSDDVAQCKSRCADSVVSPNMLMSAEPGCTTIILRNLPKSCTRSILTQTMDANGFARCYDFIHVPVSLLDFAGLGYALVNMVDDQAAGRAHRFFSGFRGWPVPTTEACEVGWSSNQGIAFHIERYRNSPLMHDSVPRQHRPALFQNGILRPFPAPTVRLQAPRVRRRKATEKVQKCGHVSDGSTAENLDSEGSLERLSGDEASTSEDDIDVAAGVQPKMVLTVSPSL